MSQDQLHSLIKQYKVQFKSKDDIGLMLIIDFLLKCIGIRGFMDNFWITIGRTIYHPAHVQDPLKYPLVVEHELVHVKQWDKWGLLFIISYLFLPLPFGFAYFRFYWEQEAYMVQISHASDPYEEIDRVVDRLWNNYGWPWPKAWMKRSLINTYENMENNI